MGRVSNATPSDTSIGDTGEERNVRWDTSGLTSAYANVCNVTSTREEVVLDFGVSQLWERPDGDVEIQLTNRIILSPFAAKRLSAMLQKLVGEYESRYGELSLE
jgi:hypothetical protein